MAAATGFLLETRLLGARSLRRTFRVPANLISTILFPLIQLFVFSQLFKDIVTLPGFAASGSGGGTYLDYLAPGHVHGLLRRRVVRCKPPRRLAQWLPRQTPREPYQPF